MTRFRANEDNMKNQQYSLLRTKRRITCVLFLLPVFLLSCSLSQAKLAAIPTETNTATLAPTNTPQPTNTPTSLPTATNTPTNTPTPDLTATAAAQATATMDAFNALIQPDLEKYNIDPANGRLIWFGEKPVYLTAASYMGVESSVLEDVGNISDFVFQSDVTWNTSSGLAGCGFLMRSEKDVKKGAQYWLNFFRLQNLPLWEVDYAKNGQYVYPLNANNYTSGAIYDEQDSTNHVAVVAQGADISVYVNGELLGKLSDTKLKEGLLAFVVRQESGTTRCKFENSWVWAFE